MRPTVDKSSLPKLKGSPEDDTQEFILHLTNGIITISF